MLNREYPLQKGADNTRRELQQLHNTFNHSASSAQQREVMLIRQVDSILEKQQSWMGRLSLSQGERELLQVHFNQQKEAIRLALEHKNQSMKAVAEANVRFVQEACNSLLLAGRSGMQSAVRAIYQENALQLNRKLEALNQQFWELIEEKLQDALQRPEILQETIRRQVEGMIFRWNGQYEQVLEEFSQLLNEKV